MSDDEGGASRMMYAPAETRNWLVLKEGYLNKTKKLTLRNSTKLRWFILKQHPGTLSSRLEYFEGMSMRGGISLDHANIKIEKDGVFLAETPSRTFILQAERGDLKVSMAWVIALQEAIKTSKHHHPTPAPVSEPAPQISRLATHFPVATGPAPVRHRGGTQQRELDGSAIDAARWAALRKSYAVDIKPDEEDEDLRLMREAEAEEERRQEEERQVWLRTQGQGESNTAPAHAEGRGDVSEEEDYEESMRQAELEEERRQQAERETFLAQKS